MGPRGRGLPRGVGRTLHPRGQVVDPPTVFSVPNILEKIIFKFLGIWRTFIFKVFLYCTDNQITEEENLFLFYLI